MATLCFYQKNGPALNIYREGIEEGSLVIGETTVNFDRLFAIRVCSYENSSPNLWVSSSANIICSLFHQC